MVDKVLNIQKALPIFNKDSDSLMRCYGEVILKHLWLRKNSRKIFQTEPKLVVPTFQPKFQTSFFHTALAAINFN